MKQLINPPIQWLLWLAGLACLAAAAWSIWQLRQLDVGQVTGSPVRVEIPDASALAVPGMNSYRKLVQAPLFWEERAIPKKAPPPPPPVVVKQEPEVQEVELMPPQGRLVGIVDLGTKLYALVRNQEDNQSLHVGDTWEGWTVQKIDSEKLVLVAGKQRTEVALIGDFSAPQVNKQMASARQRQQQRQQHQQARQAANQANNSPQAIPQLDPAAALAQQLRNVVAEQKAEAPVLSIKDALEARQRLMASRWGGTEKKE